MLASAMADPPPEQSRRPAGPSVLVRSPSSLGQTRPAPLARGKTAPLERAPAAAAPHHSPPRPLHRTLSVLLHEEKALEKEVVKAAGRVNRFYNKDPEHPDFWHCLMGFFKSMAVQTVLYVIYVAAFQYVCLTLRANSEFFLSKYLFDEIIEAPWGAYDGDTYVSRATALPPAAALRGRV